MACQYKIGENWYSEEQLRDIFNSVIPGINWWEEPEFKKRNPNFDHNAYLSSVNKFGKDFENTPEYLNPKYDSGELQQKQGITQSKAYPKTIEKIKEFLTRNKIDIKALDSNRYGGINGIADLLQNTIEIAEGKENIALPEETMHFVVDSLKQSNPALYKDLLNNISKYKIYDSTKSIYANDKNYQNQDGSLNILKIKDEAIGKLLAEFYIKKHEGITDKPELLEPVKTWWEKIVNWVKDLLRIADFNPFEKAVEQVDDISTDNQAKLKEYAELIEAKMEDNSFVASTISDLISTKQYAMVVVTIAEQLDSNFKPTVDQFLGGDTTLGVELLEYSKPYLQIANDKNEFAAKIQKRLSDKLKEFNIKKIIDDKAIDEDDKNYYTALIDGKEQRVGRTTEWAKKKNLEFTKGRDFFATLSPEQKEEYAILAAYGTKGHYDLERIVQAALNIDGTLKPKEEVVLNFIPVSSQAIFNSLQDYLLGNADNQGWLYQFEPGSVFLTEQQIFNEKATQTENGKKIIGRAGTMDLVVLLPSNQMLIYDWKFMRIDENNPRYNPLKINQHRLQLADYKRTLKEAYGMHIREIKAFTVPIAAHYTNIKNVTSGQKTPVLTKITVGAIKNEERSYLLPVAPENQKTENKEVNTLLTNLKAKYSRIYKRKVGNEEWAEKITDLNNLSDAMRHLQISLNFGPISIEAKNFEKEAEKIISKYTNFDPLSISDKELKGVFYELAVTINASKYYSDLDSIFRSEYGRENLTDKNKKILESLEKSSSIAKDSKTKLTEELGKIIDILARKFGINNILSPEKQAAGITNEMIESGFIPVKAIQFLTKIISEARSADELEVQTLLNQFDPIYRNFIKYAQSTGTKEPMSLIANMEKHELFYKIDKSVINQAKKDKNRKVILENVDQEKLKQLIRERLEKEYTKIDEKTYSQDERINTFTKVAQKQLISRDLDFFKVDFSGWTNKTFNSFIDKSLKEEQNYSKEYKILSANKALLDMYEYIIALNERARSAGYLDRKQGKGFIAYVNATMAQRIIKSDNKFSALGSSLKDMFTVQEYQEQGYGKKDEETGEIDRSVPAYFTKELDKEKRSTDLFGIVPLYIKSLIHFETSQKLEDLFQSVIMTEENKGHLEVVNGKVVFEEDLPKEYIGNNLNTKIVRDYMDDQIYGINNQYEDLISRGASKIGSKENKENRTLSTKKTIQTLNKWTQQLAVGLKLTVAVPNLIGSGLQAGINAGRYYKGREYPKNWLKIVGSKLGATDDIEKGLLDMFLPLNDENYKKHVQGIAWKQSSRKYLSTVSWQDFMMSFNRVGDISHQLANALTWLDNSMLDEQGNVVNIRKFLLDKPEYKARYDNLSSLKEKEKELDKEVERLKQEKSLKKIAVWENDLLVIPGINKASIASYRSKMVEYGRTITSQSSRENKAAYQRSILMKSFMMFKNWIVPQVQVRALDIHKNVLLDDWEYGRVRLFAKTVSHIGFRKIAKIRDIIKATPEGIRIMREMMEEKIEDYYQKTGQKLEITEVEFFDMMRKELQSEMKELELLLSIITMVWLVAAAQPPEDDDPQSKNVFKLLAKVSKKAADELRFYYNPLSAQSILQGSMFPSLGILTKTSKVLEHTVKVIEGDDDAYPMKYLINLVPGPSQFQNEFLPIIDPEMAKEMGIRTTDAARIFR